MLGSNLSLKCYQAHLSFTGPKIMKTSRKLWLQIRNSYPTLSSEVSVARARETQRIECPSLNRAHGLRRPRRGVRAAGIMAASAQAPKETHRYRIARPGLTGQNSPTIGGGGGGGLSVSSARFGPAGKEGVGRRVEKARGAACSSG